MTPLPRPVAGNTAATTTATATSKRPVYTLALPEAPLAARIEYVATSRHWHLYFTRLKAASPSHVDGTAGNLEPCDIARDPYTLAKQLALRRTGRREWDLMTGTVLPTGVDRLLSPPWSVDGRE